MCSASCPDRAPIPSRPLVFSLLFLAIALLLTACGGKRNIDTATEEGILLVGNKVEPQDLDPQVTTGAQEINIHMALFEGLLSPDPRTLEPEPGVAESWEVSPDGTRYTFHLRSAARWSDGEPLTSADFTYSWERMLSPALGARNASMLYPIKGAQAFHEGKTKEFGRVGVKAPDPQTLEVTLERPLPWFPSLLMHPAFYPVPQHVLEKTGTIGAHATGWTRPGTLVGNGPFRLTRWDVNSVVEVEKNPNYWDAARVKLNGIRFFPISELSAEELAFRAGQLHMTDALPINKVAAYRAQNSPYLRVEPYLGVYYYLVNTQRKPLDDPRVRLALALSIDRQTLVGDVLSGVQDAARSFTPPGIHDYLPPRVQGYDLKRAKQLLADAGYPEGKGFPRVELLYNSSENHRMIAEVIQAMWKQNLGIDITLRNEEYTSYLASRDQRDFDIARASWIADYPAPAAFLELLSSWSGNNFSGWSSGKYDKLLQQAATAPSPEERRTDYEKAERMLLNAAPVIPLYHYKTVYLIHPDVHGWFPTSLDWHPYKYVWLEHAGAGEAE